MKKYRNDLTAEYVRSRLDYDPITGTFTWKPVGRDFSKWYIRWNNRYAGRRAGFANPSHGYWTLVIDDRHYLASRIAWLFQTGEWTKGDIDHIDGNITNDAFSNLREATTTQNMYNKRLQSNNKTGYKGVFKRKECATYRAYINVDGKRINLGSFRNAEDAAAAYRIASENYHGEFRTLRGEIR